MNQFLDPAIKKAIQDVVFAYKEKRDQALLELYWEEEEYKEKVSAVRKSAFENFEEKLSKAKENLQSNGFTVYEAQDQPAAQKILQDLLQDASGVAKSKSNTAREIEVEKMGREITETDLGDFIVEMFQEEDMHYVLPSLHITPERISQKIAEKYGDAVPADPEKLTRYLSEKIREKILKADVGITGANFFTQTGQLVLLENEGNVSLLSRLPKKHIVICGIDKLVEKIEDAMALCQTAAIFGTGQKITQYISVISGPAKTADIQNLMVSGAQGAREVHVILLDNGRRRLMEQGFGDLLRCLNCGACINFCPVYHNMGKKFGGNYLGSKGVLMQAFLKQTGDKPLDLKSAEENGSFNCILCGNCWHNCPMKIDLPSLVRLLRQKQNEGGVQTMANQEMKEKMEKYGNPFGQVSEKEIPDKLYCC